MENASVSHRSGRGGAVRSYRAWKAREVDLADRMRRTARLCDDPGDAAYWQAKAHRTYLDVAQRLAVMRRHTR